MAIRTIERTCGYKTAFRSRGMAKDHSRKVAKRKGKNHNEFQVYHCPYCFWWHYGHRRKSKI